MPKIQVTCSQKVTYSQFIEVTDEQLEQLRAVEGDDVSFDDPLGSDARAAYDILEMKIYMGDVSDSEMTFTDLTIEKR